MAGRNRAGNAATKRAPIMFGAALAAALLAGCATGTTTPPAAPKAAPTGAPTLTPEGYGPLRVGMSAEAAARAFDPAGGGAPLGRAGDGACVEGAPAGAPPGLRAMAEQGRLTRVTVAEGATVRTERGVGVGDPAEAVDAAYGARVVTRPAKYEPRPAETKTVWTTGAPVGRDWTDDETARGLRFEIGTDGRVQAIHGGGVSIQYAEGCS